MLDEYIDNIKDEIINTTCELIQIPSVHEESSNSNKPFGNNANLALEYILNLGDKLGFRTKNIDGYCGYIEFGEGKELVGIIGHLDVVPEGEGWSYPPFDAVIENGKIYGRGAIDDKGPVVASLYAMKAILDTCKINKRVRLILGLNEERDWKCIEHYKQKEEIPSIGFSPDADFPCIYAEKALLSICLSAFLDTNIPISILSIDDANNAINVVPKFCKVLIKIDKNKYRINDVITTINALIDENHFDILAKLTDNETIEIVSNGISAHAAHPDLGKNAISPMIILLNKIYEKYNLTNPLLNFFSNYIGTQTDGKSLGLNFPDESGNLTLNVAKACIENENLKISMNLRIPVHTKIDKVKEIFKKHTQSSNISCEFFGEKKALYISKDNELVTTLCNIFNEKTNSNEKPIAIGGATYARAFPNHISFGANMPNNTDMCHQKDEYISVDNLILSSKIYAEAIYRLAK